LKYRAIIFDLDGVICHTDRYHFQAWRALADQMGIYFDEKINSGLLGVSRYESLEIILERYKGPRLSDEEKSDCLERKNKIYRALLKKMSPVDLSSEVRKTMNVLRQRGLKLAIGSSSKNARFILERIGLDFYFDVIADGNDISNSKPDPEVFVKAAALLEIAPHECLVVEDAKAGVEAALAAGMDCAATGDAVHHREASYILNTFGDLLGICRKGQ
jgi:beta-phosphoglucomutase